jgi:hypothetical protein
VARIIPDHFQPVCTEDSSLAAVERRLHASLARRLDDSWQVVHGATVRAGGESGQVEFVLLHRARGVALVGLRGAADEADPEAAVAAMQAMLRDLAFGRRFPGHLPVVALALMPFEADRAVDLIDRAFAESRAPVGIPDPGWVDWLAARLSDTRDTDTAASGSDSAAAAAPSAAPSRPASVPSLRAPSRDDAWRITPDAPAAAIADPLARLAAEDGAPPDLRRPAQRSFLLPGMALAACIVAGVLAGMAVMSHGNGPAKQSPPPRAAAAPASTE